MSDSDNRQQDGSMQGPGNPTPKPQPNPVLKWLMILFAVPVMFFVEIAKGLRRRVYRNNSAGDFREAVGIILGAGGGIALGYYHGFAHDLPWYTWLSEGIASALVTYFYAWPLAYLSIVRPAHRICEELWAAVPTRGTEGWFSHLLTYSARLTVIGGSAWAGWTQMLSAHANLSAGWGLFSWPLAFAWGVFLGLVMAAFAWWLFTSSIYGICAASGVILVWALFPWTEAFLARWGATSTPAVYGAAAVEFALWGAFLFPLVHVLVSHGLRWVRDLCQKVYTKAYDETVGVYDGVFVQLANMFVAYHLAALSLKLCALLSLPLSPWLAIALPAAVAIISYIFLGEILKEVGNLALGTIAALHVAGFAGFAWLHAGLWQGAVGAVVVGAFCATATFFLLYPLAYVLVRLVGRFILNNRFAARLIDLHTAVWDNFHKLARELSRAHKNTYSDETPYAGLFLHAVNIIVLFAVFHFSRAFTQALVLPVWLAWGFTALSLAASYLLCGKALVWLRNHLVGVLLGLSAAIASGTFAYAVQPWGLWVAVPAGLALGFITWGFVFPVAHVLTRFVVNSIDRLVPFFSKVLTPLLSAIYDASWKLCGNLWSEFVATYRGVRDWFKPFWQSVKDSWDAAMQSIKDTWDSITRK